MYFSAPVFEPGKLSINCDTQIAKGPDGTTGCKVTLESGGKDRKTTLQTGGEDRKTTLQTGGEDRKTTLQTGGEDLRNTLQTSGEDVQFRIKFRH